MMFTTKRCLIRPFKVEDLDVFVSYRNNESWMIYQAFKGQTKKIYKEMIIDDNPNIKNGLQLAITDKHNHKLLGDLYVKLSNDKCMLGYTIHPDYARQGYTYEAVKGLITKLSEYDVSMIEASAHPANKASLCLMKKLGFTYCGIVDNGDKLFMFNLK